MNTSVDYVGLKLRTPIVVGSCGLAEGFEALRCMEDAGAGAIILKSKFEEEFALDIKRNSSTVARTNVYGSSYDYISQHVESNSMDDYFASVAAAAKQLSIPLIGSISCTQLEAWVGMAKRYEDAGCRAIELDMALRPYDINLTVSDVDRVFTQVLLSIHRATRLPIIVKIGRYFTDLAKFVQRLSWSGTASITFFGSEAATDIDVDSLQVVVDHVATAQPSDVHRWIALLSRWAKSGISAASGIETWQDVVKNLLAGAKTVQLNDTLYRNGIQHIATLQKGLEQWMQQHDFDTIDQFCGRLSMGVHSNAPAEMRINAMRPFFENQIVDTPKH